jgi:hypothetical protein
MDGYTVSEAATILGVPTERVWELVARGILAGSSEADGNMRVFLKGRQPDPVLAPEEAHGRGNGGTSELSPFRELLTEFRNLTERYGQALLALGEARGEVATLRSRVDLLEARMELRLPMPTPPGPAASWAGDAPRAEADTAAEPGAEPTEHGDSATGRRRRARSRTSHSAVAGLAEALARAADPTLADLPSAGGASAAATTGTPYEPEMPAVPPAPAEEPVAAEVPAPATDDDVLPHEVATADAIPMAEEAVTVAEHAEDGAGSPDATITAAEDLERGEPDARYSARVDEPDWFSEEDLQVDVAAPPPAPEALEAEAEPPPVEAQAEPQVDEVPVEVAAIGADVEAPIAEPQTSEAEALREPEDATRADGQRPDEEHVMWLGEPTGQAETDDYAAEMEVATEGWRGTLEPAEEQSIEEPAATSAIGPEVHGELWLEEWDRPGEAAEPTAAADPITMPGGEELDDALAALEAFARDTEAEAAAPPASEPATEGVPVAESAEPVLAQRAPSLRELIWPHVEASADEPAALEVGPVPEPDAARPGDAEHGTADPAMTGARPWPAARAYRRLRRIFPG